MMGARGGTMHLRFDRHRGKRAILLVSCNGLTFFFLSVFRRWRKP